MSIIRQVLRRNLERACATNISDVLLLQRFLHQQDEAAFELLVHRHGGMVLSLCRKLLRDLHEAEDAFQATFLTLAHRAKSIQKRQSLGSWLYKVAYRICLRTRVRAGQRVTVSSVSGHLDHALPQEAIAQKNEESALLADEVARLSERLRTVVVLCYLQGKSSSEAAMELGCAVNTVSTRLFRARQLLKRNLQRRGVLLTASFGASLGMGASSAAVPVALVASIATQAHHIARGVCIASIVTPGVSTMMKGAVTAMWWKPIGLGIVVIIASGTLGWPWWKMNQVQASQQEPKEIVAIQTQQPPTLDPKSTPAEKTRQLNAEEFLKQIQPRIPILEPQASQENQEQEVARFDIDNDGLDDLIQTVTHGRGPLSTYFSSYRLRSGNGMKILKWGLPLPSGEQIGVADVFNAVEVINLCSHAASLRVSLKESESKGGPWSGKKGALAVARLRDNVLHVGYTIMTVSEHGQITIHETLWETMNGNVVEVTLDPQDDIADVKSSQHKAGGDPNKQYYLIGATDKTNADQAKGLVIVLPGGDGGAAFHPFVKRMYKNALSKNYLVVQPIARKWTNAQQITWPTEKNRVPEMKFTTEEFITAIINEVAAGYKVDPKRIYTLGWSSGGPACYAASINSPKVTGSFVAMSVFNPRFLPALENAKGHAYYLYHSPDDRVCPYRMAQQAVTDLGKAGAKVELKNYAGGHGWRGPLYADIQDGIQWLEKNSASK